MKGLSSVMLAKTIRAGGAPPRCPPPSRVTSTLPTPSLFAQDQSTIPAEAELQRRQIKAFRLSLSSESRKAFDLGRRLLPATRAALLSTMTAAEISAAGLRFTPDATSTLPPGWSEAASKRPPPIDVQVLLMDLWDYVDVLWLDFCADVHLHGQVLGFTGVRGELPRSSITRWEQRLRERFKEQQVARLAVGRLVGPFPYRIFKNRPLLAVVTAYKHDGTPRFCLDFSRAGVNSACDYVYIGPQSFDDAIRAMLAAGRWGFGALWDVASAFEVIMIHPSDADLTESFVPDIGYVYQAAGAFGAATCGYRWQVVGGRLLSTSYHVMSFRCAFVPSKDFVAVAPPRAHPRPSDADILKDPLRFTAFGKWGHQEVMLSRHGQALLAGESPLTDLSTARNTDDFLHCASSLRLITATTKVIAFVHRRYRFPLKAPKCTVSAMPKYDGFLFDFRKQQLVVPSDKMLKAARQLLEALVSKLVSLSLIDSVKGLLQWFTKIFPLLRPFLRSACEWVTRHTALVAKRGLAKTAKLFQLSPTLRSDLLMVNNFLTAGIRSRSVFLRSIPRGPETIQWVLHVDWAPGCQAGVSLCSGAWYCHTPSSKQTALLSSGSSHNSPAFEGANLPVALSTFRAEVTGRVVLIGCDNLPFIQAYYNMKSDSPPVAEAVKIVALAQLHLNCFIILDYVSSETILADPASRGRLTEFRTRCVQAGVPLATSPLPSRLPDSTWLPSPSSLF